MATAAWHPDRQRERARVLMQIVRDAAGDWFAPDGTCRLSPDSDIDMHSKDQPAVPFHLRERIHTCVALLAGNAADIAFANRILARLEYTPCDFSTMSLIEILQRHGDLVAPAERERIRAHVAHEVEAVQKPHLSFIGNNDNFPCMATHIMVVGGELLGDAAAVQAGLDNLYSLRDLLWRRGFFSEYNSPTYAGVSLHALDEIANTARHPEARELAAKAAERLWLDIAMHWHPGIGYPAGPYSRAYHNDSIGAYPLLGTLIWTTFGDGVLYRPPQEMHSRANPWCFGTRCGNFEFRLVNFGGYAGTVHHVPDAIAELFYRKPYPYRVRGTTECGIFHAGDYRVTAEGACQHIPGKCATFAPTESALDTWMEADFALGTATRNYLSGGQNDNFHVLYRLREPVREWADLRTCWSRLVVNDAGPEAPGHVHLLVQQGRPQVLQDERRALVAYSPNGALRTGIERLRVAVIFQEMTSPVDEVWIGDRRLPAGDGEATAADWVIVRDGPMYLAFYPLATDDPGRGAVIRSGRENGYRVISFLTYEGSPRDFDAVEMQRLRSGFVCELATTADYPDAPAFLADLRRAQVSDGVVLELRRVRYQRDGREMFLWYDPASQGVKAAAVNGRQVASPMLEATGLDADRVPWVNRTGAPHDNLDWWLRIEARRAIPGLEALSGRCVERLDQPK